MQKWEYVSLTRRWCSFHSRSTRANSHCPGPCKESTTIVCRRWWDAAVLPTGRAATPVTYRRQKIQRRLSARGIRRKGGDASTASALVLAQRTRAGSEAQLHPAACTDAGSNASPQYSLILRTHFCLALTGREGKRYLKICSCGSVRFGPVDKVGWGLVHARGQVFNAGLCKRQSPPG